MEENLCCSVTLQNGSQMQFTLADLLKMKPNESFAIFGSSIKDCADLSKLGERLAYRSGVYKLWSENLANISGMLTSEGKARKIASMLSDLSIITGKDTAELREMLSL